MGLPLFNIAMTVGRTRVIRKVEFTTTWTTTANAAFKLEGLLYLTSVEVISDFATISSAAGPLFLDMYRKLDDETFTSFVTSLPIVQQVQGLFDSLGAVVNLGLDFIASGRVCDPILDSIPKMSGQRVARAIQVGRTRTEQIAHALRLELLCDL